MSKIPIIIIIAVSFTLRVSMGVATGYSKEKPQNSKRPSSREPSTNIEIRALGYSKCMNLSF